VDFLVEFPSLPSCTVHPTESANQTPPPAPAGRAETKRGWRRRGARAKSRGWAAPCEIGEWMSPLNNGTHAKYVCTYIYVYVYTICICIYICIYIYNEVIVIYIYSIIIIYLNSLEHNMINERVYQRIYSGCFRYKTGIC
jgi:hypothetical protein